MDIKKIYKKYLKLYKNNKDRALNETMCELSNTVNQAVVNDEFMKNYHKAKRYMLTLNIISPGLIFGLSTGAIISLLNLNIQITNIVVCILYFCWVLSILIIGSAIFYFITTIIYGTHIKSVLYPHLIRVMEIRIDEYAKINQLASTVREKEVHKKNKCKKCVKRRRKFND